jgi:hypothetical protein
MKPRAEFVRKIKNSNGHIASFTEDDSEKKTMQTFLNIFLVNFDKTDKDNRC